MATDSRPAAEITREPGVLRMRSFRDGEVHVIALAGELDLTNGDDLERELRRVELTDTHVIALDLRELAFIGSTAGWFVQRVRALLRNVFTTGWRLHRCLSELRTLWYVPRDWRYMTLGKTSQRLVSSVWLTGRL